MAVTVSSAVYFAHDLAIYDVEATADADTTATITHALGGTPTMAQLVPLKVNFYTSQWIVTSMSATTVVITKGIGGGSGVAGNQVRVIIRRVYHPQHP